MDIAFIIPKIIKGTGGSRNIFRVAYHLMNKGHDISFYCKSDESAFQVKNNACDWYYDVSNCKFIDYDGTLGRHEVGIATHYDTAFSLKYNWDKIKNKFYFVQDFEPFFFPVSTEYVQAESTYRFGFIHICSGPWCKRILEEQYNARAEYVQFPVDDTVYNVGDENIRKRNRIIFFARPDIPRRCYGLGVSCLRKVKSQRPDLDIVLFGSDKVNPYEIGFIADCKGKLPHITDLADLYRSASLGLVFSTTNPSLVPYEMMKCGCPVCDIDFQNAIIKYGNDYDNVFLLDTQSDKMAEQIIRIMDDIESRIKVSNHSRAWVTKEFPTEWDMGDRFEKILLENI